MRSKIALMLLRSTSKNSMQRHYSLAICLNLGQMLNTAIRIYRLVDSESNCSVVIIIYKDLAGHNILSIRRIMAVNAYDIDGYSDPTYL